MPRYAKNSACTIIGRTVWDLPFGMDEESFDCILLKNNLAAVIGQLYINGFTEFLCNCEYGVPMWSAEIILLLKRFYPNIHLHIFSPYEEQAARWSADARNRYFTIHEKSDSAEILYFHRAESDILTQLYRQADEYMLSQSSAVIFDGIHSCAESVAAKSNMKIYHV